jgi:hypothetical protein
MLGIGDNFDYQGKKPNFARDCFSTLEKMKSYPETSIDPGHISFCGEDGKLYQYLPDNEVNEVTGKWRRLVDSILDANSENPIQNKVVVKRCEDLEKLIAGSAEKVKGDIDLDIETMGGIIAAGMVDLNRNMDELEEAVSEALNSLNAGHISLEEIKVNGHPITSSVNLTSTDIGLGNVDNTRDLDKPISTRVSAELNEKVDKSIRVNNKSLAQDVVIEKSDIGLGRVDNTGDMEKPVSNAVQQALDDKVSKVPGKDLVEDADIAKLKRLYTKEEFDELVKTVLQTLKTVGETHTGRKDNPHNVTKDQVGLGSVDDTSDLDKPISRAVQEALNQKVNIDDIDSILISINSLDSKFRSLNSKVGEIEPITKALEELVVQERSYGVKISYDFSKNASVKCTAIGNPKLHETLPVQNKIMPCVLNDSGRVVSRLEPGQNWIYGRVNGDLGQVMVEIPEFWYKLEQSPGELTILISDKKLPGFKRRALSYVSAYNATVDRSLNLDSNNNVRRGICSVHSIDPRYEGGFKDVDALKNTFGVQGYDRNNWRGDPDVYKQTLLGKPFINFTFAKSPIDTSGGINISNMTINNKWHTLDYPTYLSIFFLYVTEFKNIDLVQALGARNLRTEETFCPVDNPEFSTSFNPPPIISPRYIGDTDSLGADSGVSQKTYGDKNCLSTRYRGIENLVGDVPYLMHGINFISNGSSGVSIEVTMPDLTKETISYQQTNYGTPGCFLHSLNCGIIGIPRTTENTVNITSTTGFKSTFNCYNWHEFNDRNSAIFGTVHRAYRSTTFNYITKCKPSYLTIGIDGEDFPIYSGTRLCYYPEGGKTNPA